MEQGRRVGRIQPLLTTKLTIPATYLKKIIPRERLHERLDGGVRGPLMLVVAPAGFGKTTLLGEWVGKRGMRVAWVSLDQSDNDIERFWSYVIAALGQIVSMSIEPLVEEFAVQSVETAVAALLNKLVGFPDEIICVLDDYQTITESVIHQSIAFLIDHLPPLIHIVIASRIDPPFPLARLRVQGKVGELRASDLRFTHEEITEFLQEGMGLALSEEDMQELNLRSEGWIAGLQLAALSLQSRKDPLTTGNFIKAFTGSNRNIVSYLSDEVIESLPEEVQNFLFATAILGKVQSELCDAVTQEHNGERMLEWLDRANLFLSPLEEQDGWYRYQRLFAELLRYRLKQRQADMESTLHVRASIWFEQHNMIGDAIKHLLAANALERAIGLIEHDIWSFVQQGMQRLVADWLTRLPEEVFAQRPLLAYLQGWVYLSEGKMSECEEAIQSAEKQCGRDGDSELPGYIYELKAEYALLCGKGIQTRYWVEQVLALVREDDHWLRSRAGVMQGAGMMCSGEIEQAWECLMEGLQLSQRSRGRENQDAISIYLCNLHFLRGEMSAIIYTLSATLADGSEHGLWYTASAHMQLAIVYYERNELASALEHWKQVVQLSEQSAYVSLATAIRYMLGAKLANMRGETEQAFMLLEQAEQSAQQCGINALLMMQITALRIRILLEQGDLSGALQRNEQYKPDAEEIVIPDVYEAYQQTQARLAIAQGHPRQAIELLQEALRRAQEKKRLRSEIEMLIILSLAQHAEGSMQSTLQTLERALTLAESCGYVRTFLDEGSIIAVLLAEFYGRYKKRTASEQHEIASDYIATLLMLGGEKVKQPDWIVPGNNEEFMLDRLSEREQMVLSLIAEGLANQEIAQKLVVTVSTIKTHLNNIYAKLHVHTRLQAVTKAYEIGILRRSEIDTEPLAPPRISEKI